MNDLEQIIEKNRRFIDAVDYLIQMKIVDSQKELSELTGITASTFSNIRQYNKAVSNKTIFKFLEHFPNLFNTDYFMCKPVEMKNPQKVKETKRSSDEIPAWADTFINILSKQVVENEALNRQLKAELEEVHTLRAELQQAITAFRIIQHGKVAPYSPFIPEYQQAAEPND